MALTNCKECGSEISTKAESCPKCGAKRSKGMGGCGALILLVCVMGGIGMVVANLSDSTSTSTPPPKPSSQATPLPVPAIPEEIVRNSEWDASVSQVKDYLKKNLRDPDSYQSIEWSRVTKMADGSFMVRHKYRAKNGFGGYEVSNQIFTLDAQGRVIRVIGE